MGDEKAAHRREKLRALANKNGWQDALGITPVAEAMGRATGGVNHDLTEGFDRKWLPHLQKLFGSEYEEDDWLRPRTKRSGQIVPVAGSNTAADQLLSGEVKNFLCIRAPSMRPKLSRSSALALNEDGLVDFAELARSNPPALHMRNVWDRVKKGTITGVAINAVGRIGALPEAWAAAELVRKFRRHDQISVYLLPNRMLIHEIERRKAFFPMFGARVVNRARCLVSIPLDEQRRSTYSSIIEDTHLAETIWSHADHLKSFSNEISAFDLSDQIEDVVREEFDALLPITDPNTQYGRLIDFAQVKAVKNLIYESSIKGGWLPPLA